MTSESFLNLSSLETIMYDISHFISEDCSVRIKRDNAWESIICKGHYQCTKEGNKFFRALHVFSKINMKQYIILIAKYLVGLTISKAE